MAGFYAIIQERVLNGAYGENLAQSRNYRITPVSYSAQAVGGPKDAELRVEANADDLWGTFNWLGCGVIIFNQFDVPVWWGRIEEVAVRVGSRERGVSLSKVVNRVKVTCTTTDVDGVPSRYDTGWAEDTDSSGRYGVREKRYNIGASTTTLATAVRDEMLRRFSKPRALRKRGSGTVNDATLLCRGWWDAFENKYFSRSDGKDEHVVNGDVNQMLNWGVTSTLLSMQGPTTTYTRTISNARGIYTIAVSGATNATPIVITTAVAHERKSGDIVTIAGVGGNTAANGTFKVKNVTDTTFELTDQSTGANIAGNGAYTSGGTVTATSNPIVITTSVAHALRSGSIVTITGVLGNTAANGTFKVSSVTSTTFALTDQTTGDNIAGNGAYTSGGTVTITIENSSNTIMRYGKVITGATNATPIVITCAAHGYSNGAIVAIAGISGNTAANGTFKVASAATNTFALTDQTTGANVAGNGDYATGGALMSTLVDGPFAPLTAGESVIVTGSASNNGTFTVSRSSQTGHILEVTSILTSEAAGASITIKNAVQQLAQSFTPTSNWNAVEVAVRLKKSYTPTFDIVLELRNNNAGVPGATILASATINRVDIGTTMQWEKVALSSAVALTSGTTYWLLVRTTAGATFYDDGFIVALDTKLGYSTGALKGLTPSSAWIDRPVNADMPFRVLDSVDTARQIETIFTQVGTLFVNVDVPISSGITSNQYRSGENSAAEEISKLIEVGSASGLRLLPSVSAERAVRLATQPSVTGNEIYDKDGVLFHPNNTPYTVGALPVGQWVREHGLPRNLDFMVDTAAQFVEEAEYNCERGELTWWGQDDDAAYGLPGVTQG